MDISGTVAPKSDQMNADDFISGAKTYTIDRVSANEGTPEQPVNVFMREHKLPFRPCKSMRRVMIAAWGPDASQYAGRSLTLYRDPEVKFGGMAVGGIRISHMSHIDGDLVMALTASKAKRASYRVQPLKVQDAAPQLDVDEVQGEARAAAKKGKDAFGEWWKNNPDKRPHAKLIIDELRALAEPEQQPQDDDEVPL